jgi:hypothetical protein
LGPRNTEFHWSVLSAPALLLDTGTALFEQLDFTKGPDRPEFT